MRLIDGDVLKESLKESRDNCRVWLQDCKEARSQKWIGRAEQALMTFNECLMRIDTIPTIEPGQKTGKWKEVYAESDYRDGWIEFTCENCEYQHGLESGQYGWHYGDDIPWKYCPICGAKMEAQDETD